MYVFFKNENKEQPAKNTTMNKNQKWEKQRKKQIGPTHISDASGEQSFCLTNTICGEYAADKQQIIFGPLRATYRHFVTCGTPPMALCSKMARPCRAIFTGTWEPSHEGSAGFAGLVFFRFFALLHSFYQTHGRKIEILEIFPTSKTLHKFMNYFANWWFVFENCWTFL